jgi:hypothetical protein
MPRRSQASLSIAAFTPDLRRLEPPPELGGVEAEIFRLTVNSVAATHFQAEDLPLLCAYARAAALERRAAEELQAGHASPWLAVYGVAMRAVSTLSVRLRIGARSRSTNTRSPKPGLPPSAYDLMRGQRDDPWGS